MSIKVIHSYSKDTETFIKIFLDKDFIEKKYNSIGATNVSVLEHGEKDGKFIVKTQRDVAVELPNFAKKILKPTNTIIETDIWDLSGDVKTCSFDIDSSGVPVKMNGTMTVKDTENGCENHLVIETKVNVPLIGGKIAKIVEKATNESVEAEYQYCKEHI